jgi:hypothetical protein
LQEELPPPEAGEPKELPPPEIVVEPIAPLKEPDPEFQPYVVAEEPPVIAALPAAQEPPALPPVEDEAPLPLPEAIEEPPPPPSLPVPIPRRPTYPDTWIRDRARYFSSGRYAPAGAAESFLAPDLLFRLGLDKKRQIVEMPPIPPPSPVLPPAKPPARLLDEFTTNWDPALRGPDPSGRLLSVDPLLLTLFFADREDGPSVPAEATAEYLAAPSLLAHALTLRTQILHHWTAGRAPLTTRQLNDFALEIAGHPGTALLLCHNVTKSFARGGHAIRWEMINRAAGEYSDGESSYRAAGSPLAFSGPSILPALFAADAGSWYRYFACATAVCYSANAMTRIPVPPPTEAAEETARQIVETSRRLRDTTIEWTPAYRGWLWANAWVFVETAAHVRNPQSARTEALNSMQGASFGLSQAGATPDPSWRWSIPQPGAAGAIAETLPTNPNAPPTVHEARRLLTPDS